MEYVQHVETPQKIVSEETRSRNPKIAKSVAHFAELNLRVLSVYLTPARTGPVNTCTHHTRSCEAICVSDSRHHGFGRLYGNVFNPRRDRTERFARDIGQFVSDFAQELRRATRLASRTGQQIIIRPNMGSDIDWPALATTYSIDLFGERGVFPELASIQHYGYTKDGRRVLRKRPPNDYLVFSRAETKSNQAWALRCLAAGHNVAVVFGHERNHGNHRQYLTELPDEFQPEGTRERYRVIDGDTHDFRHLDPRGPLIVGLRMKGDKAQVAAALKSGFAVRAEGGKE